VTEQVRQGGGADTAVAGEVALRRDIEHLIDEQSFAEVATTRREGHHAAWRAAIFLAALTLSGFQLYTGIVDTFPSHQQRTFHLAFGLGLVFLLYPAKRRHLERELWAGWILTGLGFALLAWLAISDQANSYVVLPAALVLASVQAARYLPGQVLGMPVADALLAAMGFASGLYLFFNSDEIIRAAGRLPTTEPDVTPFFVAGTVGVLLVLAAAQRAIGSALTVLAALMLTYAYLGPYLPGFLGHGGYRIDRIIATSFLGTEGVFGTPIAVSSTFIFMFMIFAAMLQRTGMEKFFTKLAVGLAGGFTGGTAKVGVLTSAFSGTITGSSVANTVSNGAFTIPMMRRSGYQRDFAGAVEAASSTGGQFAPPIMGAAAFIMIEITGIPYIEIIKAAAVPAILFFAAQFIVIHYESKKQGIRGLPRDQLPGVRRLLAVQGYLLAPIILIFVILSFGFTPMRAALWAIAAAVLINIVVQLVALVVGALRRGPAPPLEPPALAAGASPMEVWWHGVLRRGHRRLAAAPAPVKRAVAQWRALDSKLTVRTFPAGMVDAARIALPIIAACAAAGLIAGVITLTGLGLKLVDGLLAIGQNNLYLVLFFVMISCLVLGIGVPTTANYVITATLAAPALLAFDGVPLLAAHMFVYYFGVMADITPPVCLAAYAAAGISGGNPIRTGVWSVRIAISGFIVPYMFVLNPQLLLLDTTVGGATRVTVTALIGVTALGAAVAGYVNRPLNPAVRLVLVAGGLLLISGSLWTDVIGIAVVAAVFGHQWWITRRAGHATGPTLPPLREPTA
jgi:TRAP transporter 4TM/12TM fusion protein